MKNISRYFVWIIMALVMVGLVGFGSVNFGGTLNSIGKVGDTEINASAYFRELNSELNAWSAATGQNLTMVQAQALGIDQSVLERVIATTALENETARVGISVSDRNLADRVTEITAFQGPDGTFDRDTYDFVLEQSGLTISEFEESLRAEVARTILAGAVTKGVAMPDSYTNTLYAWARETRDFTWAEVTSAVLDGAVPAPTEAEVQAYYDANPDAFTTPETRQITYGWLRPEDVIDEIPVDEGELRAIYDARISEFQIPERRLVERLVFGTEEEAAAAAARIEAGETTFDDEVTARGLALTDVDLGDVTPAQLGAGADAVFALTEPGTTAPVMSDLGPAIFRMNAILAEQITTFEDAADDLAAAYSADAARRLVRDRATEIDELLAGGATLEELADEGRVTLGTIAYHAGIEDGIAAYAPFRAAAAAVTADDFPEVTELDDGGLFALRLDDIVEPALKPLDDVRDEATAAQTALARTEALQASAEALLPEFASAAQSPSSVGLTEVQEQNIDRTAFITGAPATLVPTAFEMDKGSWQVITDGARVFVLGLTGLRAPDQTSAEAVEVKTAFAAQTGQTAALDLQGAFAAALEAEAGVTLDQAMINAVHANFP